MFQFTHPVRGATDAKLKALKSSAVSIHAPRAGCDDTPTAASTPCEVSIHAPRAGCDSVLCWKRIRYKRFNSRTPCGVRQVVDE